MKYIWVFFMFVQSATWAGSITDNGSFVIEAKKITNISQGNQTIATVNIGTLENAQVNKVKMHIVVGDIYNIAEGTNSSAQISIAGAKNKSRRSMEGNIYIQDVYNEASGWEQSNKIIIQVAD